MPFNPGLWRGTQPLTFHDSVPQVFQCKTAGPCGPKSCTKNKFTLQEYLHYAKIVSGVRLRQAVSPSNSDFCVFPNLLDSQKMRQWLAKPCFPSDMGILAPEVHEAENFENLQREEFLFPDASSLQELIRQILDMEDGCAYASSIGDVTQCRCEWCKSQSSPRPWIDETTTRVEISMVVYNAQYGSYTYVSVNFIFNRGGHIHSFLHCLSTFVNPFLRSGTELAVTAVAAFLWVGALVYAAVGETLEIISAIRNSNAGLWKALWEDYIGFYNVVDWSSILIGTFAIGYYIQSRIAAGAVNEMMPAMIDASLNPGENYKATVQEFFTAAEYMSKAKNPMTRCEGKLPKANRKKKTLKIGRNCPKRKWIIWTNHPFSGGFTLAVSFREGTPPFFCVTGKNGWKTVKTLIASMSTFGWNQPVATYQLSGTD